MAMKINMAIILLAMLVCRFKINEKSENSLGTTINLVLVSNQSAQEECQNLLGAEKILTNTKDFAKYRIGDTVKFEVKGPILSK